MVIYFKKKVYIAMVNNSININKMSPQIIEHLKKSRHMTLET